jgi:hypothetical protein
MSHLATRDLASGRWTSISGIAGILEKRSLKYEDLFSG